MRFAFGQQGFIACPPNLVSELDRAAAEFDDAGTNDDFVVIFGRHAIPDTNFGDRQISIGLLLHIAVVEAVIAA